MDMSFSNQVLSAIYLVNHAENMANKVHDVPLEIDQEIAKLKLAAMNIQIDLLTEEQNLYLSSWQEGT